MNLYQATVDATSHHPLDMLDVLRLISMYYGDVTYRVEAETMCDVPLTTIKLYALAMSRIEEVSRYVENELGERTRDRREATMAVHMHS